MTAHRIALPADWTPTMHATSRILLRFLPATVAGVFLTLIGMWCIGNFLQPKANDFLSFWAAAKLAGPAAYDIKAHAAVEAVGRGTRMLGLLPFPYPPPFLLFLWPFGFVSYPLAFAAWVVVTGGLFAFVTKPAGLSHPSVFINGMGGQIAFLTTFLFVAGFKVMARNQTLGGAILSCLIIKPQVAVLIPVALLAGRCWPAMIGAVTAAVILIAAALMAFGSASYAGFLAILPVYTKLLGSGSWEWNELASTYALARFIGLAGTSAMAIHIAVAAAATYAVWRSWRRDEAEKVPVLASASVLISPYILSYDCLFLAVPFVALLEKRPVQALVVWALALSPVLWAFQLYDGPNLLPLAALCSLVFLYQGTSDRAARFTTIKATAG